MPMSTAATQNPVWLCAVAPSNVAAASATMLMAMVTLPPTRSSTTPNAAAPRPAATLMTMPNITNCVKLKPNVPTA